MAAFGLSTRSSPQARSSEPSSRVSAFDEILSGLFQGSEGSAPGEAG